MNKWQSCIFYSSLVCLSSGAYSITINTNNTQTPPATTHKTKINLNQADTQQLAHSIKGLGIKRATAIITYRQQHKLFHNLKELNQVPGLGKNFFEHHQQDLENTFEITHTD